MFTLDQVVPWGRSFAEYRRMFDLTDDDLDRSIIGCGDGPASFNAEASRLGRRVISCDPLYRLEKPQIQERIAATFDQIIEQTRRNAHEFVWGDDIRTVEELGRVRMRAMQAFLDDYELGRAQDRYLDAELPNPALFRRGIRSRALLTFSVLVLQSARRDPRGHGGSHLSAARTRRRAHCSWLDAFRSCARRDTTCPLRRCRTNSSAAATG